MKLISIRSFLIVMSAGLLIGLGSTEVESRTTAPAVEVTAWGLNVRSGPSTRYRRVGLVRRGQDYAVVGRRGSWVRIQFGSRPAWVHGAFVRNSSASVRRVTARRLNVRRGPSSRYGRLGSLPRGARVAVTGRRGSWRRIHFGGRTAWLHGAYLTGSGSSSTRNRPNRNSGSSNRSRPKSRAGFIQLAASGPGFYGYDRSSGRWGTPRLIYGLERIGRRWKRERRGPRMGVGDISNRNGGRMAGHSSHRRGVDADIRPVRNDGREAPVTIHQRAYSRSGTQHLLNLFAAELRLRIILFNDGQTRHTTWYRGHHNHFHASIR